MNNMDLFLRMCLAVQEKIVSDLLCYTRLHTKRFGKLKPEVRQFLVSPPPFKSLVFVSQKQLWEEDDQFDINLLP